MARNRYSISIPRNNKTIETDQCGIDIPYLFCARQTSNKTTEIRSRRIDIYSANDRVQVKIKFRLLTLCFFVDNAVFFRNPIVDCVFIKNTHFELMGILWDERKLGRSSKY